MPITKLETVFKGQLSGLAVNNDASDLNNNINFAIGSASDSTGVANITLTSPIVKQLDTVWSAGTLGGGLDTGTKTSSQSYHMFIIKNPSNGLVDALFSLSATAPTLPSGYTLFRRVASMYTDASANWAQFSQHGDYFFPSATQVGYSVDNVAAVTNTAIGIGFVPQGIQVKLIGQGHCSAVNNQTTGYAWFSAIGQSAPAANSVTMGGGNVESSVMMASGSHTAGEASANWHQNQTTFVLLTNTSAQIILTSNPGSLGGNVNVRVRVQGWIDARGQ